ncbi:glycine--tRNA ligase, mitochondrial 1 [Physcomitrium patens]|uniref:glycine--tRNA ligase n=1 Tax=Physcomitrium patens TaxID=3218 RepID=A0A2K1KE97_PHYPA|nr:glycine--tRNA ligase, mitochondrial 1-like [Physcomitrium patens]PNR52102.1 hypothetical protein PHYPA_008476 [Physcomitrium patens]|eukprot:XP_024378886.1 glycine--tRNA ligase, mitochondrial 1-like [Physcomitrella patens]
MATTDVAMNREAFKTLVKNTLERRLFYIPSYKIYGGVAGFYDYGPWGCQVETNVLNLWRQHFVMEEDMWEIRCPCVTPEVVLKASGHVDKFTDLMVKDLKLGSCFRADHLLKDFLTKALEDDARLVAERAAAPQAVVPDRKSKKNVAEPLTPEQKLRMQSDLAGLDEFSGPELGEKIKAYSIKAPESGNDLSDPYPFNLMFSTQIGPTGTLHGYMRPETAQGIFVNFRDLYYESGNKLPFAAAQIGSAYRNEIAPRQGPMRVREFTMAEIEHFVNPDDKSHPKFKSVENLVVYLFPRAEQMALRDHVEMRIGDAVAQGIVDNETLGYFIARTYLFLTKLGIDKKRLRFRQHLANEMAHYAQDCWDAEIECSYGWFECVGCADRSAYDLKAHTAKSGQELTAYESFAEPKDVVQLTIVPNKKVLGKEFRRDQKILSESLEAMNREEALALKAKLEEKEKATYKVCSTGQEFTLTKEMVAIEEKVVKTHGRNFTPSVIEPSFGIGRIMYCLYEHCFYLRPAVPGEQVSSVFRFPPIVAPIKCTVFPLMQREVLNVKSKAMSNGLTRAGVSNKLDITGRSIGKRYARTDEVGIPFAITVDFDEGVTVRERDSKQQVRIPDAEVVDVVRDLSNGTVVWEDVAAKYKLVTVAEIEAEL